MWVYNGSNKTNREVKLMDKIFDLLDRYDIRDYCVVSCTSELLYVITFRYKDYCTIFSFFEYEFDKPRYYYYIEKIIENLADIVKAF